MNGTTDANPPVELEHGGTNVKKSKAPVQSLNVEARTQLPPIQSPSAEEQSEAPNLQLLNPVELQMVADITESVTMENTNELPIQAPPASLPDNFYYDFGNPAAILPLDDFLAKYPVPFVYSTSSGAQPQPLLPVHMTVLAQSPIQTEVQWHSSDPGLVVQAPFATMQPQLGISTPVYATQTLLELMPGVPAQVQAVEHVHPSIVELRPDVQPPQNHPLPTSFDVQPDTVAPQSIAAPLHAGITAQSAQSATDSQPGVLVSYL